MTGVIVNKILIIPLVDEHVKTITDFQVMTKKLNSMLSLHNVTDGTYIDILSEIRGIKTPVNLINVLTGKTKLLDTTFNGLRNIKDTTIAVFSSNNRLTKIPLFPKDYVIILYDKKHKSHLQDVYYLLLTMTDKNNIYFVNSEEIL